jgi:transposase
LGIIDSQSVKNTESTENKGYDAGKKISGIKRHILVDTNGLPHAIHVTTADVTDRNGAIDAIKKNKKNLSKVKKILADGGYTGKPFFEKVNEVLSTEIEIAKRNELHKFKVIPKRWIVERSFSWLEKCRRLWKNCERKINSSLHMIILCFVRILVKRF